MQDQIPPSNVKWYANQAVPLGGMVANAIIPIAIGNVNNDLTNYS